MTHQELKKRLISIGWKLYSIRGEINTSSMYKAKGYRITYAKVLGPHTMSAQATRWIESESYEDILYFFTT